MDKLLRGRDNNMLTAAESLTDANRELNELLTEMCEGNPPALTWLSQAIEVTMYWDHVFDSDGITQEETLKIMRHLLIDWPLNPFYRANCLALALVSVNVMSAWVHSNNSHKIKAYDPLVEIPCTVAFLLGGHGMVDRFMPRIRELTDILYAEDEERDNGAK